MEVVIGHSVAEGETNEICGLRHLYILVIVAILVTANVLANRYNKSYDSTSNKRYSLSDQTAKIVKGLKQNATITYFDQTTHFSQAKDLLDQYAQLVPQGSRRVRRSRQESAGGARSRTSRTTAPTIVQIGAKKEEAKSLTEEGITGAFIRDLKNNTRTVCFVTGSGEHQIDDTERGGYSRFKDLLGKDNYAGEVDQTCCRRPRSRAIAPCWW